MIKVSKSLLHIFSLDWCIYRLGYLVEIFVKFWRKLHQRLNELIPNKSVHLKGMVCHVGDKLSSE